MNPDRITPSQASPEVRRQKCTGRWVWAWFAIAVALWGAVIWWAMS